jgi:CheY-like chemotaxis protein
MLMKLGRFFMKLAQPQIFLPLIEFPSKVILVDDNIDFVKSLQMFSSHKEIEFIAFNDPRKALTYLQECNYRQFVDKYLEPEDVSEVFSKNVHFSLSTVYQEIYNPKRFDEISTLVIDYAMPGLTGQEFCKKIANLPIQKLLLTGEASYEKAVEMFNSGTINKFIKKDEDLDLLLETIKRLQNKYFQNITQELFFALQTSESSSLFSDEIFIDFFKTLCKENNFIEYYVVDENGSYLLADKSGTLKLLIVKSDEDMKVLYEIADGDDEVSDEITNLLRERKKIAFFQSAEEFAESPTHWNLHDALSLEGAQTYYYALVDAGPDLKIDSSKIVSYLDYLKKK